MGYIYVLVISFLKKKQYTSLDDHQEKVLDDMSMAFLEDLFPLDIVRDIFQLGEDTKIRLCCVTLRHMKDSSWKGISIMKQKVLINFHKDLIHNLLVHSCGGSKLRDDNFSCKDMTKIESAIVTKSMTQVLNNITAKLFIDEDEIIDKSQTAMMIWQISDFGKVMLEMPYSAFCELRHPPILNKCSLSMLSDTYAKVDFVVGAAKILVGDLKELEIGDCILLTDSSSSYMGIKNLSHRIPVKSDHLTQVEIELTALDNNTTEQNNAGLELENFQIEITGEFRDLRMKLADVMALQEGYIVDLADLDDATIYLTSQDKLIATGHLIIVNNRFGVVIDELLMSPNSKPLNIQAKEQQVEETEPDEEIPPVSPTADNPTTKQDAISSPTATTKEKNLVEDDELSLEEFADDDLGADFSVE